LPRPGVLIISAILAAIVVGELIETPNVKEGGAVRAFWFIIVFMVSKVAIEFCLNRWEKKRDRKRTEKHEA
jgi:hypothetical protein